MERVNRILHHKRFQEYLGKNMVAEEGRRFCHHDMGHFLAAALLHDIGRWKQYEDGTPHEKASALLAPEILAESGFTEEEAGQILTAILDHRNAAVRQDRTLSGILYRADKMSRSCFCCEAEAECDWKGDKKNLVLQY